MKKEIYAILAVMSVLISTTACKANEKLSASVSSTIEIASSNIHSEENSSDLIQSSFESKAETSGEKRNSEIVQGSLEEEDEMSSANKEPEVISSAPDLTSGTAAKEEKTDLKEIPKDDAAPINSSEAPKLQNKTSSSENPMNDDVEEEIEIIIGNPTTEEIEDAMPDADIFIIDDVVCVEVTPKDWAFNETYTRGKLLGKIVKMKTKGSLGELEARTLPVGTKIYETDHPDILIVQISKSESERKYFRLREG